MLLLVLALAGEGGVADGSERVACLGVLSLNSLLARAHDVHALSHRSASLLVRDVCRSEILVKQVGSITAATGLIRSCIHRHHGGLVRCLDADVGGMRAAAIQPLRTGGLRRERALVLDRERLLLAALGLADIIHEHAVRRRRQLLHLRLFQAVCRRFAPHDGRYLGCCRVPARALHASLLVARLNEVGVLTLGGGPISHLSAVPAWPYLGQRGRVPEPLRKLLHSDGTLQLLRLFQDLASRLEGRASLRIATSLLLLLGAAQGLARLGAVRALAFDRDRAIECLRVDVEAHIELLLELPEYLEQVVRIRHPLLSAGASLLTEAAHGGDA